MDMLKNRMLPQIFKPEDVKGQDAKDKATDTSEHTPKNAARPKIHLARFYSESED